ncbi:MAG: LytTR family DNA-binding domain-containing protein [Eubacteriales bacterium]|nr:LytTR family DNA-binding domain-containing protein [Eubacteriales bacterium]
MITVLSYLEKMKNISLLQEEFHSQAAFHSEEDWKYLLYTKMEELREALKLEPVLDILCWNVSGKPALRELENARKRYREAFLLLIADSGISPMEYLRPSIMPTSLLLQPFGQAQCRQVLDELVGSYCRQFRDKEDEDTFLIETREERQRVPLSQICFVEARDKKIYICTRSESFGFYETIDHMAELLPAHFMRCHRSFIVNMKKVKKLHLSEGLIEMEDAETVPLSRSYKKAVREYVSG